MTLTVYDFEIFYKSKKTNSADELSRRFNYEKTSTLNIKLLLSLQSKLALLINMRNSERIFNDVFELASVSRFKFMLNANDFIKMFKSASTKSSVQKFKSSTNV